MERVFREVKTKISFDRRYNINFPAHVHDEIELVYVKRGGGVACCDGTSHTLTANSLLLVLPNQVHYYTDCEDGDYIVLILKPSALFRYGQLFTKGELCHPVLRLNESEDDGIVALLETACREHTRDGYSDIIAAYLTALFGKLLTHYTIGPSDIPRDTVLRILQYCAAHYKEEISVDAVARHLGISRSSVSHIFSTRIRMGFCDYIHSLRLKEAEELVESGQYSVTEVAALSGFPTIRTFNRAFLKKHGVSPSAYRKAATRSAE